ncbi:hypothetical protein ACRAWD_18135 [Caulobacter segnis]
MVTTETAAVICALHHRARRGFLFAFLAGRRSRPAVSLFLDLDLYIIEARPPPRPRRRITVFEGMCLQVGSVSSPDAYLLARAEDG